MTREKFIRAIAGLGATFGREMLPLALDGYWSALQDLEDRQLALATKRALLECKFMPAPATLRELAGIASAPPVETAAMVAWQAVRSAIDRHDYLVETIDFGPLVNAVIRNLGGWDTLCRATLGELDNPGWLRKRFDEIYRAFARVDAQALNGSALEGRLPPNYRGAPNPVIAIGGGQAAPRLPPNGADQASAASLIRDLAEAKS